jgi:putative colanic acid biosynthesis acetyltransferase WcaF
VPVRMIIRKKDSPLSQRQFLLGPESWIAAEVFVHPGVTIGEGSVIGARSVVTKDMPSWNDLCRSPL